MKLLLRKTLLILMTGSFASTLALEEPKYKVIKEYDDFEIRKYESFIIAEVEVDQEFEEAGDSAFRPLFDYISGNNVTNQEMEMTVPVNQSNPSSGEEMEMTVPVAQSGILNTNGKYAVSFVLPLKYTLETAPKPKDERVIIKEVPGKVMAVLEYSGTWSEENYREHEQELFDALKKENIQAIGDPVYARYNPPFWPWFLRTNEVQVEVDYNTENINSTD
jgi:hypothetical protein